MNTRDFVNTYTDTRGHTQSPLTFTQATVKGIAQGGGLFVPRVVPKLSLSEILALEKLTYAKRATTIYQAFGVDLPLSQIEALMHEAYADNFDTPAIAPVVKVAPNTYVLELWHGPTSAFKDMALQCMPVFFSTAIDRLRAQAASETETDASKAANASETVGASADVKGPTSEACDYLILVATSGDTGKAALEGFKNRNHTSIIVFYPHNGVSDIQYRQMATQQGDNVGVFGIEGNFDDCQTAVKEVFNDIAFNQILAREHKLCLSSANSINWGRLLPQIAYYVSAYVDLVSCGALAAGDELDICVPTGNFGNILAAYYAREIGVPLGTLFCASNENRVLTDFINTGIYDIADRPFKLTPSPSMDILVSSNLERQLFELNGRNPVAIRQWMDELGNKRRFQIDTDTFAALRSRFSADWVSSNDGLLTIKSVFEQYGYLLDPHTAVAWKVAERLRGPNPVLVVSTAHWAKFGSDVYRALNNLPAGSALPAEVAHLSDVELNALIAKSAAAQRDNASVAFAQDETLLIPQLLAELNELPLRFTQVHPSTAQAIKEAVLSHITRRIDS